MKQLTEKQIVDNWNKLIQLIKDTFPEDYPNNRREKLLKMYHYFEDRMSIAPASGIVLDTNPISTSSEYSSINSYSNPKVSRI